MASSVRDGGQWKEIKGLHVRDNGQWKEVIQAWVRDGGQWKPFYAALPSIQVADTSECMALIYAVQVTVTPPRSGTWTLQRSVDGGTYTTVDVRATDAAYNYNDGTVSNTSTYKYRVGPSSSGPWAESEEITPCDS